MTRRRALDVLATTPVIDVAAEVPAEHQGNLSELHHATQRDAGRASAQRRRAIRRSADQSIHEDTK